MKHNTTTIIIWMMMMCSDVRGIGVISYDFDGGSFVVVVHGWKRIKI